MNCTEVSECEERYIDASLATSLTLICETSNSCKKAKVQCPLGSDTECNIYCQKPTACAWIYIDGRSTNFSLSCGNNACYWMDLIEGPTDYANIACNAVNTNACTEAKFNLENTTKVDVLCHCGGSRCCPGTEFIAPYADELNIKCVNNDCAGMIVEANYSKSVSLDCLGTYSCINTTVYAQFSQDFNLNCDGITSCIRGSISCPYSGSDVCRIECSGDDSCNYMTIFVDENYQYDYLNLSCYDEKSCSNVIYDCGSFQTAWDWYSPMCDSFGVDSCCPWESTPSPAIPAPAPPFNYNCTSSTCHVCKSVSYQYFVPNAKYTVYI